MQEVRGGAQAVKGIAHTCAKYQHQHCRSQLRFYTLLLPSINAHTLSTVEVMTEVVEESTLSDGQWMRCTCVNVVPNTLITSSQPR